MQEWASPSAGGAGLRSRVKFSAGSPAGGEGMGHGPGTLHPPGTHSLGARSGILRSPLLRVAPFSCFVSNSDFQNEKGMAGLQGADGAGHRCALAWLLSPWMGPKDPEAARAPPHCGDGQG